MFSNPNTAGWLLCLALGASLVTGCSSPSSSVRTEKQAPAEPVMPVIKELAIGQPGTFGFLLPGDWSYTPGKITSPLIPAGFRVDAPDKATAVQVSISWDGIGPTKASTPTMADLEVKLRVQAGHQNLRTAVERHVVVKSFDGTDVIGLYTQFTEAQWTNVEVPKGVYPIVTDGVFRTGNLWGTFTIYSQDKAGPGYLQAFAMVKSFRKL